MAAAPPKNNSILDAFASGSAAIVEKQSLSAFLSETRNHA
jgi:hypothetical protein